MWSCVFLCESVSHSHCCLLQVSIDANAALASAVAGLAALPNNWESKLAALVPQFAAEFGKGCPNADVLSKVYAKDRASVEARTQELKKKIEAPVQ